MRRYKASNYNFVAKADENTIVFNARNCALVKVNSIFTDLLAQPNDRKDATYEDLAEQMFNAGFLVDEEIDELSVLEHEHNEARYNKEKLTLTILSTFDCNFRCFYCFEDKKSISLTDKEIEGVKSFTAKHIVGVKELNVCWFGGEPLLNPNAIWDLSEYFITLANEKGFKYSAIMITNGSLITDEIIEKIKKAKISSLQITVDGDRDTHNKRRGFINGEGSYDIIMDNISKVTVAGIKVICRINLDKSNYNSAVTLINNLADEKFSNFQISFGHLLPLGEGDNWSAKVGYSMGEFAKATDDLAALLDNSGIPRANAYPFYPRPIKNFCGACQVNSFVIHPNGDIFRCYDSLDYKIGDVFSGVCKNDIEKGNNGHWVNHNPFKDEECKSCKVLPLCMGGCPHMKDLQHQKLCLKWKDDIENVIVQKYRDSKRK